MTRIYNKEEIIATLSESQKKVFTLIADSEKGAKEISIVLNISPNSAKKYINDIYAKFGVHSRAELHKKLSEK